MSKAMVDNISISFQSIEINIPLWYPITAIVGDAGSYKSFTFSALKEQVKLGTELGSKLCLINAYNLEQWHLIRELKDKIFVIDNVDTLCSIYPEAANAINDCCEYMIIMGRQLRGLRVNFRNVGELHLADSKLTFVPLY